MASLQDIYRYSVHGYSINYPLHTVHTIYSVRDKFLTRYTMMYDDGSMLLMQLCSYKYNTVQLYAAQQVKN